jgi:hypothetical protein
MHKTWLPKAAADVDDLPMDAEASASHGHRWRRPVLARDLLLLLLLLLLLIVVISGHDSQAACWGLLLLSGFFGLAL